MQRAGVPSHHAAGVLEQSHELSQFAIPAQWLGIPARRYYRGEKFFFARTVVYDAAQTEFVANGLTKRAESFGRPTFGTPTAARTENDVGSDSLFLQLT